MHVSAPIQVCLTVQCAAVRLGCETEQTHEIGVTTPTRDGKMGFFSSKSLLDEIQEMHSFVISVGGHQ